MLREIYIKIFCYKTTNTSEYNEYPDIPKIRNENRIINLLNMSSESYEANTGSNNVSGRVHDANGWTTQNYVLFFVCIVIVIASICLVVWKWTAVVYFLTWPYYSVCSMLATSVTVTQSTGGVLGTMLNSLGLASLPQVVVTQVASTWWQWLLAVVANGVYLVGMVTMVALGFKTAKEALRS